MNDAASNCRDAVNCAGFQHLMCDNQQEQLISALSELEGSYNQVSYKRLFTQTGKATGAFYLCKSIEELVEFDSGSGELVESCVYEIIGNSHFL